MENDTFLMENFRKSDTSCPSLFYNGYIKKNWTIKSVQNFSRKTMQKIICLEWFITGYNVSYMDPLRVSYLKNYFFNIATSIPHYNITLILKKIELRNYAFICRYSKYISIVLGLSLCGLYAYLTFFRNRSKFEVAKAF